ncbi:MAG TPA: prolipoprotein diacylglyceryl transferase [Bdellovibrionota bacterium]|jgi:phosphatidylglycerol:prolipoprotein diacylglycerol transferase
MLTYPQIDPVIFHLGPIQPRWYGLMYLLGFLYTFRLLKKHARWIGLPSEEQADSVLASLVLGLIVTARIVYVLFYNLKGTLEGPWWEFAAIWHGGLAFHGGLLGVVLGALYVSRKYKLKWNRLTDVLALATPVGLGLGRIANFINGELWGRVTDVPWGMVFPNAGSLPRHPSQLYEAFLEGPVLFVLLQLVWRRKPNVGVTSAAFLLFYAAFRISMEFFREPDVQVGYVLGPFTMGQLLSVTMVAYGCYLLWARLTRGEAFDASPQNEKSKGKKKA